MNGIRGKITVNGQPIDEYAKEQQEKDFTEHMCRHIFEIHHEIEETVEDFIYKVFDENLRETGRGSFSKADLYRAVYLLEEEKACRLPTIEERKTGRWIDVGGARGLIPSNDFKCSVCGNFLDFNGVNAGRGDANYCPNCGAKMEGAEE